MLYLPDTLSIITFEKLTTDFFSSMIYDDYLDINQLVLQDEDYQELKHNYKKYFYLQNLICLFLATKKYQAIKPVLQKAIQVLPNNSQILFYHAYVHFFLGEIPTSLISARKINYSDIPIDTNYYRKNRSPFWHDFHDEFFTVYNNLDECTKLNSTLMRKINHLIIDAHEFGLDDDLENSLSALQILVNIVGEVPYLLSRIGSIYETQEEYKLALTYYQRVLDAGYDVEGTYFSMAYIYIRMDDYEQEADCWFELVKLAPDSKFYIVMLAKVYSKLKRIPEAVTSLEKALEIHPDTRYEYADCEEISILLQIIERKEL